MRLPEVFDSSIRALRRVDPWPSPPIRWDSLMGSALPPNHSEVMKTLAGWGLPVSALAEVVKGVQGCERYFEQLAEQRDSLPFDIDGIVFKVDALSITKSGLALYLEHPAGQLHVNFLPKKR